MTLTTVVLNTQASADVYFYQADGVTPLVVTSPVTYVIRTQNNQLITSSVATQDPSNAAHYVSQFTLPSSAPVTPEGAFYTIVWTATVGTSKYVQTFNFTVTSGIQQDPYDTAILVLQNSPFTVTVNLPYSSLTSIELDFTDVNNNVVDSPSTASVNITDPPLNSNGLYTYQIPVSQSDSSLLVVPFFGVFPYFAYINYTAPNNVQGSVIPVVYVVTTYMLHLMNSIRRFSDRIRNNDVIPQLRITDIDLMHFAFKGLEYVNAQPPANFYFSLQNILFSTQFSWYVEKAACLEMMQAMYLAYGMSTFQFQGQAVQLDYEPTQFIQAIIQELRTDLAGVGMAKNAWARSGGFSGGTIAAISGSWGVVSNIIFRVNPFSVNSGYPALPFLG